MGFGVFAFILRVQKQKYGTFQFIGKVLKMCFVFSIVFFYSVLCVYCGYVFYIIVVIYFFSIVFFYCVLLCLLWLWIVVMNCGYELWLSGRTKKAPNELNHPEPLIMNYELCIMNYFRFSSRNRSCSQSKCMMFSRAT